MCDFALTYGALIIAFFSLLASCTTLFIAWRALQAWKTQKEIAYAEKCHDALWEKVEHTHNIFHRALVHDIWEDNYQKQNTEASMIAKEMSHRFNNEQKIIRMLTVFPELKDDLEEFDKAHHSFHQNLDKIVAKFSSGKKITQEEKFKIVREIDALFHHSIPRQRIMAAYKHIADFLTSSITSGLK